MWKKHPGTDYTLVSRNGEIKSMDRYVTSGLGQRLQKGKILSQSNDKDGYLLVGLYRDGKVKTCKVHRVVAETYIPNPDCKPEVNHINGNKKDNRVENLEWVTRSENVNHAISTGLTKYKEYPLVECISCKKVFQSHKDRLKFCSQECSNNYKRSKSNNPGAEVLYVLLCEHKSLSVVGDILGESRQTINKWCKREGIPHTAKYYKELES